MRRNYRGDPNASRMQKSRFQGRRIGPISPEMVETFTMIRAKISLTASLLVFLGMTAAKAEDKAFHSLFNGKDFTGWVLPADPSIFSVENGEIVAKTDGKLKKNEFLVTDKPYTNFVLKAKLKLINHNSGIQFRSKRAENGAVSGPQADAADGYWGLLYEERGRGILEQYPKDKAEKIVKKQDWNDYVITAKGSHVTIDINGTRVIDRTDPKFDPEGIIAFQAHAGPPMEVRFKDVEIKELD
jgi:hypothetical protein